MIIKAVLNLVASDASQPRFVALVEELKKGGVWVFLHPLTRLKRRS